MLASAPVVYLLSWVCNSNNVRMARWPLRCSAHPLLHQVWGLNHTRLGLRAFRRCTRVPAPVGCYPNEPSSVDGAARARWPISSGSELEVHDPPPEGWWFWILPDGPRVGRYLSGPATVAAQLGS
jgi:hypothetical protein